MLGPDPLTRLSREASARLDGDAPSADEIAAVREALRARDPARFGGLLLVAFLVIEVARSGGDGAGLIGVLVLGGILAVHELGHAAAMVALGYRDVRVYLVPLLGGLTTGRAERSTAVRVALVSLAGPLPGLLVAAGLTLHAARGGGPAPFFVVPLALLNALNLLPLGSLDGGRVLSALLLGRPFALEAAFWILSVVGLAALSFAISSYLVGGLALLTLLVLPARRGIRRAAEEVRAVWGLAPPEDPVEDLPGKELGLAIQAARRSFSSGEPAPGAIAQRVRLVVTEARTEPAGALGAAALVALFALGWAAAAVTLLHLG